MKYTSKLILNGEEYRFEEFKKPTIREEYHIPHSSERQAVYNIWTALGGGSSDGTNLGIALKLPFAGSRSSSSASVSNQGGGGCYWSSTVLAYSTTSATYLYFRSGGVYPQNGSSRCTGSSVRCFKNTSTMPTSSWTKLYGTSIEAGGIFWSSTDGLISLSSDGQTWITMQDKNLGATTVRNDGDVLSENNCGRYYQRGNMYGFPFSGGINTSSDTVDASGYGPYEYESDTFITGSAWDSSNNTTLFGEV